MIGAISTTSFHKITEACERIRLLILHQHEIQQRTGEAFNLYSIMGAEHDETTVHSKFLAELLNPAGSHQFGSVFLKLFLKMVPQKQPLDPETTTVFIEKSVGSVNHETNTGGRIDIFLQDHQGHSISIENKIYAGDQPGQVARYCNYQTPMNTVLYLTLWGNDASKESKVDKTEGEDYHLIAYHDIILKWLHQCQKEAVNKETVRTGIGQYLYLIRKLTNQTHDHKMDQELLAIVSKYYQEIRLLSDHLDEAERKASYDVFVEVRSQVETRLKNMQLKWEVELSPEEEWVNTWQGMNVETWIDGVRLSIRVEGQSRIWRQPGIIGFTRNDGDAQLLNKMGPDFSLWEFFQDGCKSSQHWHAYKYFLGWNQVEERAKLFDETERQNNINYIVDAVKQLLDETELRLQGREA